jgi:hypothetical protein
LGMGSLSPLLQGQEPAVPSPANAGHA